MLIAYTWLLTAGKPVSETFQKFCAIRARFGSSLASFCFASYRLPAPAGRYFVIQDFEFLENTDALFYGSATPRDPKDCAPRARACVVAEDLGKRRLHSRASCGARPPAARGWPIPTDPEDGFDAKTASLCDMHEDEPVLVEMCRGTELDFTREKSQGDEPRS